jgi:hypothetical protein
VWYSPDIKNDLDLSGERNISFLGTKGKQGRHIGAPEEYVNIKRRTMKIMCMKRIMV